MVVKMLLSGLKYEGQLSLRRKIPGKWYEYLTADNQDKMIDKYGYYVVIRSCIIDGVLVIYVE